MTSTVRVNMTVCAKKTIVTVDLREDGRLDLKVRSECSHVRDYARDLKTIGMEDVTELHNSVLFEAERRGKGSATCLVPSAIINAAWVELGLMARSRALGCGTVSIDFIE